MSRPRYLITVSVPGEVIIRLDVTGSDHRDKVLAALGEAFDGREGFTVHIWQNGKNGAMHDLGGW